MPDALWVHELVGATVRDAAGTALGTVASVEANPASDLMVLESGGLIPVRFVTAHDAGRPHGRRRHPRRVARPVTRPS